MQFRKPQVQKLCFIPPKIIVIEVHSLPPELSQMPMSSLCVKFQPSSTPPNETRSKRKDLQGFLF